MVWFEVKNQCEGESNHFTFAGDPHILIVVAVVDIPAKAVALAQLGLVPFAVHVIQKDEPRALSKVRSAAHRHSHAAVQLLTHHVGIHHVPVVVAHRSPWAVVEHLHPALTPIAPVHQLYLGDRDRNFEWGAFAVQTSGDYCASWRQSWLLKRQHDSKPGGCSTMRGHVAGKQSSKLGRAGNVTWLKGPQALLYLSFRLVFPSCLPWYWASAEVWKPLSGAEKRRMWWRKREEEGRGKKRSNYLLKGVFWLPILTRLYIDCIHFPVTLDRLTSQQEACSESAYEIQQKSDMQTCNIIVLNYSIQSEIHVILSSETAIKHSSTLNVTMLKGRLHFENVSRKDVTRDLFLCLE